MTLKNHRMTLWRIQAMEGLRFSVPDIEQNALVHYTDNFAASDHVTPGRSRRFPKNFSGVTSRATKRNRPPGTYAPSSQLSA
jgi:hypothetical protein